MTETAHTSLLDTPFAWLFDALTNKMGVLHTTETTATQRDRVVWERSGDPSPEPTHYRLAGQKTLGRDGHPHAVTVYGASDVEVSARVGQLRVWIDRLVGPPQGCHELENHHGYKFAQGKGGGIVGGDGKAMGYATTLSVTLYTPVVGAYQGTAQGTPKLQVTPLDPSSFETPTEYAWSA